MSLLPEKIHSIDFCLSIGCNVQCKYCPQDKLLNSYMQCENSNIRKLSYEDFQKIMEQVAEGAAVSFAGMSEPFANPDCAKMIKYAYEKGFKVTLFSTLKGMREEDIDMIRGVRFTTVTIHIPDKQENSYFPVTDHYLKILKLFSVNQKIDAYSCHGEVSERVKELIDDKIYINSHIMNRAGNLEIEGMKEYRNSGKLYCSSGTVNGTNGQTPVVLPNGDVTMCSTDYSLKYVFGNLLKQTWGEIIRSDKYIEIERAWDDETLPVLCRTCPEARVKEDRSTHYNHLAGASAIKIARAISNGYDHPIFDKIREAKGVCIWGAGKLFTDNYLSKSWDVVCRASIVCDMDQSKWGQSICGLKCVSPVELKRYKDILIIVFIRDDRDVMKQIHSLGYENVISIYDIYNALD